jgi:hypothetical protein
MTTTRRLVVQQNNDTTLQATIMNRDSTPSDQPFNITGMKLDFWIKDNEQTSDTDPDTVHLSTLTGEIVMSNPPAGIATIFIARTHVAQYGEQWYRLDVTSGLTVRTAGNGALIISAQ